MPPLSFSTLFLYSLNQNTIIQRYRNKRSMGQIPHLRNNSNELTQHPCVLCAKLCWNWPSGSGEEILNFICICIFCISILYPLVKGHGPLIWTNLNPLTQECFLLSLVEIVLVVYKKKTKNVKSLQPRRRQRRQNNGQISIRKVHLS